MHFYFSHNFSPLGGGAKTVKISQSWCVFLSPSHFLIITLQFHQKNIPSDNPNTVIFKIPNSQRSFAFQHLKNVSFLQPFLPFSNLPSEKPILRTYKFIFFYLCMSLSRWKKKPTRKRNKKYTRNSVFYSVIFNLIMIWTRKTSLRRKFHNIQDPAASQLCSALYHRKAFGRPKIKKEKSF